MCVACIINTLIDRSGSVIICLLFGSSVRSMCTCSIFRFVVVVVVFRGGCTVLDPLFLSPIAPR